jgi:GDP-4-dehydro-6-deoxy-D-mannose reductase
MSGFLGRHLKARLADANPKLVSGLEGAPSGPQARIDIRDGAAVRAALEQVRPDVVFHLAGRIKAADPQLLYDTNLMGTVTLLDVIRASGLRPRVVLASSSAVYRDAGAAPINEGAPVDPLTHYGASKAAAELVVKGFTSADGIDAIVARMFNVIGPGQGELLAASEFARQIALRECGAEKEGPLRVGRLNTIRDFVDVRDVANALLAIAAHGRAGATYNVCSGRGVSIRGCLEMLLSLSRVPLRYEEIENPAAGPEVSIQLGDRSRIERELGWTPSISLEQSLGDLLEDWRRRTRELANGLEQ